MISIMVLFAIAYIIVGIGYAKVLNAVSDDSAMGGDFVFNVFAAALWPIGLTISAFWNFK